MLFGQPIRQIAYHVKNIRESAQQHSRLFGSGPFYIVENINLTGVIHRGKESAFYHSSAFGQWGGVQVEIMQQNRSGPSILHDLHPEGSGRYGLHHVALIVDDLDGTIATMAKAGFPEVFRGHQPDVGMDTVFLDTVATFGHFVELYRPVPALVSFFEMIEQAAIGFDGRDVIRELTL